MLGLASQVSASVDYLWATTKSEKMSRKRVVRPFVGVTRMLCSPSCRWATPSIFLEKLPCALAFLGANSKAARESFRFPVRLFCWHFVAFF